MEKPQGKSNEEDGPRKIGKVKQTEQKERRKTRARSALLVAATVKPNAQRQRLKSGKSGKRGGKSGEMGGLSIGGQGGGLEPPAEVEMLPAMLHVLAEK